MNNREFIVLGWDSKVIQPRRDSVQGLGNDFQHADVPHAVAGVQVDLDLRGSEGATVRALTGDGIEEGTLSLTQEVAADLRGSALADRRRASMSQIPSSVKAASTETVKEGPDDRLGMA